MAAMGRLHATKAGVASYLALKRGDGNRRLSVTPSVHPVRDGLLVYPRKNALESDARGRAGWGAREHVYANDEDDQSGTASAIDKPQRRGEHNRPRFLARHDAFDLQTKRSIGKVRSTYK